MTRRVTVLEKAPEPLHFAGHGPHQLPLDRQVDHVWEQASDGGRQTPDVWEFSLPATARTQVDLSAVMRTPALARNEETRARARSATSLSERAGPAS